MVIAKDLFKRLDRLGEDPFIEWDLKPHFLNELAEGVFASELAKLDVLLPSVFVRASVFVEKLERTHLRKRVIDIVERKLEDMELGEPAVTGV